MMMRCLLILMMCLLSACGAIKKTPTVEEQKDIKIAEINIQLGIGYLDAGNIQRAKQKLLYALLKAPKLPEAWYTMAYFQEVTGNQAEAKIDYLKAIELAPKRGDTQNNYGTFLCRIGNYTEAIQHFMAATQDPRYLETAGAYENAGLCALKIPDRALAKHYFSLALESDPSRKVSLAELNKLT